MPNSTPGGPSATPPAPGSAVIFDGDDTLWSTEVLYDRARTASSEVLARAGLDPGRFKVLQKELDLRNVEIYGLSAERFPTSSVEAYRELASLGGLPVVSEIADEVYRTSASVFQAAAPLVAGAAQVLADLGRDHHVALVTKGDRAVQRRRIVASGLAAMFETVLVVDEKSEECFVEVLTSLGCGATASWSVGNSLPSDISPALEIGMQAIWIDSYVWEHEHRHAAIEVSPRLYTAARLDEVAAIVRGHAGRPAPS